MYDPVATLGQYGGQAQNIVLFDEPGPDLLPYASLTNARHIKGSPLGAVIGVYEWQGEPLLFIVDAEQISDISNQVPAIRRLLAMRGDAPYLGIMNSGRLTVYSIALDRARGLADALVDDAVQEAQLRFTIPRLGNLRPGKKAAPKTWVTNIILRLLNSSIETLTNAGLSHADAISLVGRALFTRFLADRNLLPLHDLGVANHAELMDDPRRVVSTCAWLDNTFNGDLLPVSAPAWSQLSDIHCRALGNILHKAPDGELLLGWDIGWDGLDFSQIPVGILSQAYENYLRTFSPSQQRSEGGYYTPTVIADMMVKGAFSALRRKKRLNHIKALDPAAGGGVFLLTLFRELVAEHWRETGTPPNTAELREILYTQIRGFDVNPAALKFAALGIYLLAIELDPSPEPVEKLRFKKLLGLVLHQVGDESTQLGKLGSLGPHVGEEHNGVYDLVIGNPPWSHSTGNKQWSWIADRVGQIAQKRLREYGRHAGDDRNIELGRSSDVAKAVERSPAARRDQKLGNLLPNEVLDLPFVWRAMEWARPDGQIAFALHGRLLVQQADGMFNARRALFGALNVTSVVNGAELRKSRVWPEVKAPFCVIFANNAVPSPDSGFRFINSRSEHLNDAGILRVDALSAAVVATRLVVERPEILKILFRGGSADMAIYDRLLSEKMANMNAYWKPSTDQEAAQGMRSRHPEESKTQYNQASLSASVAFRAALRPGLSGNGYQSLRPTSPINPQDNLRGEDASKLLGLPHIQHDSINGVSLKTSSLEHFDYPRLHRGRSRELYCAPMLVVHQTPPRAMKRIRAAFVNEDAVFSESFYGYSAVEHPQAEIFIKYLVLVLGSSTALWFGLMTSGKFGFERDTIELHTMSRILFPPFETLTEIQKNNVLNYFDLVEADPDVWEQVDEWVYGIYGLALHERQVIIDTLDYNLPYAENAANASKPVSSEVVKTFCSAVKEELNTIVEPLGLRVEVSSLKMPGESPWQSIVIGLDKIEQDSSASERWARLLMIADELAAAEVEILEGGSLVVARLNQARYWSLTQARLLAQKVFWEHPSVLEDGGR